MGKENKTRYVILGLLSHEPMSGYDIKKRTEATIGYVWDISYGQIYPELKNMLGIGWVTMEVENNNEGPDRKVYSITPEGVKEFTSWMAGPVEQEKIRSQLMVKIFFGGHMPEKLLLESIGEFKGRAEKTMEIFNLYENQLQSILDESDDHFFMLLTVLFGKHLQKAYTEWSTEVLEMLEKRKKDK